MTTLDNIEITLPSDESATWITVEDMKTLLDDGVVIRDEGDDLYPEDGPFRIVIDEKVES